MRIWDCENLKQKTVLKPTLRRAGRVAINAVAYNTEGSVVAGGLFDGSIQLWDVRGVLELELGKFVCCCSLLAESGGHGPFSLRTRCLLLLALHSWPRLVLRLCACVS